MLSKIGHLLQTRQHLRATGPRRARDLYARGNP
jgi:hypothetical protein